MAGAINGGSLNTAGSVECKNVRASGSVTATEGITASGALTIADVIASDSRANVNWVEIRPSRPQ